MKLPAILLPFILLIPACRSQEPSVAVPVRIQLRTSGALTRALEADELKISDYNLLIFNCFGILEEQIFVPYRELQMQDGSVCYETTLLQEVPYTILAAANLGYALPRLSLEEALAYRYHLAYPDEYSQGLPMAACLQDCCVGNSGVLDLPLERLMARIDIRVDRRALDAGVRLVFTEARLGNCPSSVRLFGESKAETAGQVFLNGYSKTGGQVRVLNSDSELGVSGTVSLYLLENCQGTLLEGVSADKDKLLTDGLYPDVCSYVELKSEYYSESWHTRPGGRLVYRFYLGESLDNFDVRRNVCYPVTVRPEGDGLRESSWRVDQEEMEVTTQFDLHPAAYNECTSGEDFHLWCEVLPRGTPVTIEPIGYEDERVAALYQYTLDEDGCGLTIHTWKGGTAIVYFSAGAPVNRDTLAMLVIDP